MFSKSPHRSGLVWGHQRDVRGIAHLFDCFHNERCWNWCRQSASNSSRHDLEVWEAPSMSITYDKLNALSGLAEQTTISSGEAFSAGNHGSTCEKMDWLMGHNMVTNGSLISTQTHKLPPLLISYLMYYIKTLLDSTKQNIRQEVNCSTNPT